VLAVAAGLAWAAATAAETPLPDYGGVAAFALVDEQGRAATLEDLSGKIWAANFMFANCPSLCPMMNMKMGLLQRELPADIRLMTITVDPKRDTPQALAALAKGLGADPARWRFLTGDKAQIDALLHSFHMNPTGDPDLHSLKISLVDGGGRIRGYYDGDELAQLKRDARRLQAEGGP
jgi:cytochrome oxidase Cu insertion factor (SCO1/SenC/PrrC family)